jgi:hypothetical protein
MLQKTISNTETYKHVSILCRRFTQKLKEGTTLQKDKSKFRKRIYYNSHHVKRQWVFEETESGRTLLVTVGDTTAENTDKLRLYLATVIY